MFNDSILAKDIAETAREFFATGWTTESVHALENAMPFPSEVWRQVAELGWLDLLTSEFDGGAGLGVSEAAPILEAAGYSLHVGPLLETMLGRKLLASAGVELPAAAAVALAIDDVGPRTEPVTSPMLLQDGAISGVRRAVQFADLAEIVIVTARESDTPLLVALDSKADGVTATALHSADRVIRVAELNLKNVSPLAVLATGSEAIDATLNLITTATALVNRRALGVMEMMLKLSVTYAKQRHQFGRPIGSFQAVQHRLADMFAMVVASRSLCRAAEATIAASSADSDSSVRVAKAYISRGVRSVAEHALQIHGGIGFTDEHALHLYYKHGLSLASIWGTADEHEEYLASLAIERATR